MANYEITKAMGELIEAQQNLRLVCSQMDDVARRQDWDRYNFMGRNYVNADALVQERTEALNKALRSAGLM